MTEPLANETARRHQLLEQRKVMIENTLMDLGYASEQEQEIAKLLKLDRTPQLENIAAQTKEWLAALTFTKRKLAELPAESPHDTL